MDPTTLFPPQPDTHKERDPMSREIDVSKGFESLSKSDLIYLRDRGRLTPEQEREYLGGVNADPPEGRSIDETPHTGDTDVNATNPSKRDGSPDNDPSRTSAPEELPENYEDWKVAQLEAEISERNTDRSEEYQIKPESGKKGALIAALAADDEAEEEE